MSRRAAVLSSRRAARTYRWLAVYVGSVLLASVVVAGMWAVEAGAYATPSGLEAERYPTVCPPRPAEYTGSEANVGELVAVEQELSDACVRGEQLAAQSHGDATAQKASTDAVTSRLGEAMSVDVANEPTVKTASGGGGGGSSSARVESFGPSAEATLSEGVEGVEVLIWCVIGAMLAGVLFMYVLRLVAR